MVAELPPHSQALARAVLMRLVTPERTRAIVSLDELGELSQRPDEVMRLVEHLVHARLLVVQSGPVEQGESGKSVEIVHESLIHSWPLLRRWLDENQDDAA
jgi:eukaryotic-like serine/threonine-protein kinase